MMTFADYARIESERARKTWGVGDATPAKLSARAERAYRMHTDDGVPMREIARQMGVEASTVMRMVRRAEDALGA